MSDKKMIVTVSPLGVPKIEMVGYSDGSCVDRARGVTGALSGGRGVVTDYKPEASVIVEEGSNANELIV